MQTLQTDYFAAYRNLKLSRDAKGVLVAEFHSDGGPFIMNAQAHTDRPTCARYLGFSSGHRSRSNDEASVRGLHQGQQSIRTA
jgi:hypothetical protein